MTRFSDDRDTLLTLSGAALLPPTKTFPYQTFEIVTLLEFLVSPVDVFFCCVFFMQAYLYPAVWFQLRASSQLTDILLTPPLISIGILYNYMST